MLKDLWMKTFKTLMKEIFKRHEGHISYLLIGRINILIHPYYLQLSSYSLQSLSKFQGIFHKTEKKKNSTKCIKLLLFSCQVLSDSLWLHRLRSPDFPVPYHLLEYAQVRAHWIGDAIQPSHPLSPSFSSPFNLSQHQGLFQWVSYSH